MKLGEQKPKLTLTTLRSHHKAALEPVGLLTPPLFPMASVPFQWEEVPGRPRPIRNLSPCPSPSLGPGPIRKPKSARLLEMPPGKVTDLPSPTSVLDRFEEGGGSILDIVGSGAGVEEVVEVKVKITRLRRRNSLFSLPHRRCQLLFDSMYGSLKQMLLRGCYDKRS